MTPFTSASASTSERDPPSHGVPADRTPRPADHDRLREGNPPRRSSPVSRLRQAERVYSTTEGAADAIGWTSTSRSRVSAHVVVHLALDRLVYVRRVVPRRRGYRGREAIQKLPVIVSADSTEMATRRLAAAELQHMLSALPAVGSDSELWFRVGKLRAALRAKGLSVSSPVAHVAQCPIDTGGTLLYRGPRVREDREGRAAAVDVAAAVYALE